MLTDSEYCISAGEFAKICNTTRDALRYYDKMGILVPKKNESNGYNYYSYGQITSFYFINFFKTVDLPIKELREYFYKADIDYFYPLMHSQYESLLQTRKELDKKISLLAGGLDVINHIRNNPEGKVLLETNTHTAKIITTEIKSFPATNSTEIASDLTNHIERCSEMNDIRTFPIGAVIDKENFYKNEYNYKQVFSFADNNCNHENAITLPTNRFVSCVNQDSSESILNIYERIKQYIKDNDLTAQSDIYCLSLFNFIDTNREKKYLKYIFVCV